MPSSDTPLPFGLLKVGYMVRHGKDLGFSGSYHATTATTTRKETKNDTPLSI